jgi:transposase
VSFWLPASLDRTVQDKYQWFWLYTAVEPTTGESFSLYLPSLDSICLQVFLEQLKAAYPDDALLLVMDWASSHGSTRAIWPQDTQPLLLPSYSPQLNPAERCFQELRRALSNRLFETLETLQGALTDALRPFWHDKPRLAQLTGYP